MAISCKGQSVSSSPLFSGGGEALHVHAAAQRAKKDRDGTRIYPRGTTEAGRAVAYQSIKDPHRATHWEGEADPSTATGRSKPVTRGSQL